jgi:hypothetical protein
MARQYLGLKSFLKNNLNQADQGRGTNPKFLTNDGLDCPLQGRDASLRMYLELDTTRMEPHKIMELLKQWVCDGMLVVRNLESVTARTRPKINFKSNSIQTIHRSCYCFWHFDHFRELTKYAQLDSSPCLLPPSSCTCCLWQAIDR